MDIHTLIYSYFNNPIMTKIENKDNKSYYYTKIQAQLLNSYRYLIVITEQNDEPIHKRKYLKNINWISLQTRALKLNHNIPTITYNSSLLDDYNIKVLNRNKMYTTYTSKDFTNIQIHVLVTSSNIFEYPEEATISNALEKYQTLLNIII